MSLFSNIVTKKLFETVNLATKVRYFAVFHHFKGNFARSSYFLRRNAVMVSSFQVITGLVRNKIRITICQKQLLLSRFFWFLDFQLVQIHHLLQAQHLSQSRLLNQCLHKNTKDYSQEPAFAVPGLPQMHACGGVS